MSLSPAELLDLEDQPENGGSGLRMFGAIAAGVSAASVVVPILVVLWYAVLGRPGGEIPTAEAIAAEIRAAGKAGERTDAQLLDVAKNERKARQLRANVAYRPLEYLMLSSTAFLAAWLAALYAKLHDEHGGQGQGSIVPPTVAGTFVGAAALWLLAYLLIGMPAAAHGGHGHGGHDAAPGAAHGGPMSLGAWLADNRALAEIIVYLGGAVVASIVAAAVPRGQEGAAAAGHAHAAAAH